MSESQTHLPEYHQSSIGMFLKCPRQYMYRYLMNLVLPPKSALTLGRAVDSAVTHNFTQKIETEKDLKVTDVLDVYSSTFDKEAKDTEWEGEDPGEQKDLGYKMLNVYHEVAAPKIQPATVQDAFRIEFEEFAFGGTLDLTDKQNFVRDTKTSKTNYDENAVSDSIQATMYDFAFETKYGKKPRGFKFDVITKHKIPRYQEVSGQVSNGQRDRLFESVNIMHAEIKDGRFQYAPEGAWWCSKSWCGYWDRCKGKKS